MSDKSADDMAAPLREVAAHLPHAPIAPAHGIASIALAMSMKYHDIATVQDGTLYQQYKLEGKNMRELHLDMIFETAIAMERHLLASNERIAAMIVDALEVNVEDDAEGKPDVGTY